MKKNAQEIRTVLKGCAQGLSAGRIAAKTAIPKTTVQRMISRGKEVNVQYDQAKAMTDFALEEIFSPKRRTLFQYAEPDFEDAYLRHARKSRPIGLSVLWTEYVKTVPDGYKALSYPAYCKNYTAYTQGLPAKLRDVTMTFHWAPADVVMIDYSGDGIEFRTSDGKTLTAQIFVGVLPHSDYIFCYATPDQTHTSWFCACAEMFKFFGGVTNYIFLDNSTSLVPHADRFNPTKSPDFLAFCSFFHTAPYVCRPYEPRDKALVENAVGQIQRRILNLLSEQQFFSIDDINTALRSKLDELNNTPMVEKMKTRAELFAEEAVLLQPLPLEEYEPEMIEKTLKVRSDYRIRYKNRRFSVPYKYVGQTVKVVIYPHKNYLDCFDLRTGERIAHHDISSNASFDNVLVEHMPAKHLALVRTQDELIDMVALAGAKARELAEIIAANTPKRNAVRLLNGLLSYQHRIGNALFEDCCKATLKRPQPNYDHLLAEIDRRIGGEPTEEVKIPRGGTLTVKKIEHNIRGAEYYKNRLEK